jgi:type II secretory pathway pseudopilin PulG
MVMRISAPDPRSRRQAGYNLVMLMIAITLLNVALAASLPMWSQEIRRDKEEELMSRGWQYVEAIRVFQNRFQRLPVRLEELIEVKPRCIRQLWKDPMTDSGKFMPIFQNQGRPLNPQSGPNGRAEPKNPPDGEGDGSDQPGGSPFGPKDPEAVAVGPIIGVRSRSDKKSILVFFGHEKYNEWEFTLEELLGGQRPGSGPGGTPPPPGQAPQGGGGGAGMTLSTRWLGRPLPTLFEPAGGTLPGGGKGPGSDGSTPGGGTSGGRGGIVRRP